ncbi:hypothetical protein N9E09_00115 [bacterium]|jgi:hypothetical protein|nr:hypothetical protein [bacterium]
MIPGAGKYPIGAITDWDNEIKKHIPEEKITETVIDDFDEFVLSIQSEDDINMQTTIDSITYNTPYITSNTQSISGTIDVGLDLFSFHDNIETYEQKTERRLETIEKRLCILEPKKDMLEKYVVLQDLYKQYMAAEALLQGDDDNDANDEDLAY